MVHLVYLTVLSLKTYCSLGLPNSTMFVDILRTNLAIQVYCALVLPYSIHVLRVNVCVYPRNSSCKCMSNIL